MRHYTEPLSQANFGCDFISLESIDCEASFWRCTRLRARQLGQTVVSSSRRLPRVDNRPCSACRASAKNAGCVRGASYGCETKLPLARLPAHSAARRPLRRGRSPTVAREHVCGPDVISTDTVRGAREGARVEIMSEGCPQTAGRASRSGAGLGCEPQHSKSSTAFRAPSRLLSSRRFCYTVYVFGREPAGKT